MDAGRGVHRGPIAIAHTEAVTCGRRGAGAADPKRVLDAALRLADQGGLEGLSMRKLGQALRVEGMALYYHFANKERVFDRIVELSETMLVPFAPVEYQNLADFIRQHAMQPGYDFANEFEIGLDVILEGLERVRDLASDH